MWPDLWLLENQLPLFILNDLFNLAKTAAYDDEYEGLSLITITFGFAQAVLTVLPIENSLLEIFFLQATHFLDWLRLSLQPSQEPIKTEFQAQNIPSAMELHQGGVKFQLGSSKTLLDISFNKGTLESPFLTVYDNSVSFYRNILAFENMHGYSRYFNDYVIMMSYLVNTAKDAELLIQNGVIGLGNSERLSSVFRSLVKESSLSGNFQYSGLVENLNIHCGHRCNKWKAILKQNYFNTPWASISVVAAVILLVLTCIQTACSIVAL
ncbi:hypothetical protein OWV82_003219 [Melia azedarach]|uniref:Uncharacterized protein n=1 Tax=Melia azedarach TaxID=155640 RepID=A0ACC1YLF2_MELAZ|nr:hypothetical protein OWV82_003219 [Melia azedarach]